jgi:hypothetical protein
MSCLTKSAVDQRGPRDVPGLYRNCCGVPCAFLERLAEASLHISKDEQKRRLLAREQDPRDWWKLSLDDWQERAHWDAYQQAYEDALGRCGAPWAPWFIVPANHKWYRNYIVAKTLVERLTPYEARWRAELDERGKAALKAIHDAHAHQRYG